MKHILIYFGSGALFGMGACFGVAISAFCVSWVRKDICKDTKEYNNKVLAALQDKCEAIWAVEAAIKNAKARLTPE